MTSVSVITPVYQAEDFLGHAVRSVLNQTHPDFEMVIASDDGKDYLAILAGQGISDPRLRLTSTGGIGTGVPSARSCALDAAKGDIIISLDADDKLHPRALEQLVPLVQAHGAAYSDVDIVNFETGQSLPNYNRPLTAGLYNLEEIVTSNIHTLAWVAFDRRRLPHARWPEWAKRWEDVLFFGLCCDHLGQVYHVPEALYTYSRRQGSMCNIPGAVQEFEFWAAQIVEELQTGRLTQLKDATRATLDAYFKSRILIESLFEKAVEENRYSDYQHFLRDHPQLFYQLPPVYSPR